MGVIEWEFSGVVEGESFHDGFGFNDRGNEGVNIDDFCWHAWETINNHVDEFNLEVHQWSSFLLRAWVDGVCQLSVSGMTLRLERQPR